MILVHIYIAEHKGLKDLNVPMSSAFSCFYTEGSFQAREVEDNSSYYFDHHCTALIGPNGVGKSSILEILELLTATTDSIASVVFFDQHKSIYRICPINMHSEYFGEINTDHDCEVVSDKMRFIEEMNLHLVKVNALSSDVDALNFKRQESYKHVHDLTFRQNLKSSAAKKKYFDKLLSYYNNSFSRDDYMEEVVFEFVFSLSPKSIIERAVSLMNAQGELLPDMLSLWGDANQVYEISEFEVSHGSVFQALLRLNALSIISYLANSTKSEQYVFSRLVLEYYKIDHEPNDTLSTSNRLRLLMNRFGSEVNEDDSSPEGLRFRISDVHILRGELERILDCFENISLIVFDHCIDYDRECLDLRSVKTADYFVVEHLTQAINELPLNIANNVKWGWRGISSGELARTHIFSESFHYLRNTDRSHSNILLIDEADLYLHPEWQRNFVRDFLVHLSGIEESRNLKRVQIVICTHSPIIISDFLSADIVSLLKNQDNETEVGGSIGFGNSITDIYMSGMHLKSTFGEHGRIKIAQLLRSAEQGALSEKERALIEKISSVSLKNFLLNHDKNQ